MSKGRYCMMWTILAHLASLVLSYAYGVFVLAWIGSWLWRPLKLGALWLYERAFALLPLPRPVQSAYLHNAGLTWLSLAILFQLAYLVRWASRRAKSDDLAEPHPGDPGDQYYESVRRRVEDYREALHRWRPKLTLRIPTWRYYKRLETDRPDLFWRGRTLVIEKSLLQPHRVHELGPYLARTLMYYNCEDVAFLDILAYYPDRWTWWQFWWNALGICPFLPVMLVNRWLWKRYWQERVRVADAFAYGLGQGHLLHFQFEAKLREEEALKQQRRDIAEELTELQRAWNQFQNNANRQEYSLPHGYSPEYGSEISSSGYDPQKQFTRQWDEVTQRIVDLQRRDRELGAQESQSQRARPMLEDRMGLLAARLGTERTWMERQGLPLPAPAVPSLRLQEPSQEKESTEA